MEGGSPVPAGAIRVVEPQARTTRCQIPSGSSAMVSWACDPDVELMLRAKDGDSSAFQHLFRKHCQSMLNFAYRYVGNHARAEELVQDAFLQIYRARDDYEPRARFLTYAYRVVINLCLNELRRAEYRGRSDSLERGPFGDDEPVREVADDRIPGCEDSLIGVEVARRIRAALSELPVNQRIAILMTRLEGCSQQEVADVLETSPSAVKSLVFRGMRTLRDALADVIDETEVG